MFVSLVYKFKISINGGNLVVKDFKLTQQWYIRWIRQKLFDQYQTILLFISPLTNKLISKSNKLEKQMIT